MDYTHTGVPRELFKAEEHAVRGQAGDGCTSLLPARVQVMEPDVRDITRESLHRHSAPPGIVAERAGGREALIEEHSVQRGMIQGDCGRLR